MTRKKGNKSIRPDLGHLCRSSWEANYARYLRLKSIEYEYEATRFLLKCGDGKKTYYVPDFKVGEKHFIEVKGVWDKRSRMLRNLMAEQYPLVHIEYVGKKQYLKLEEDYAGRITNWEYRRRRIRRLTKVSKGRPTRIIKRRLSL